MHLTSLLLQFEPSEVTESSFYKTKSKSNNYFLVDESLSVHYMPLLFCYWKSFCEELMQQVSALVVGSGNMKVKPLWESFQFLESLFT